MKISKKMFDKFNKEIAEFMNHHVGLVIDENSDYAIGMDNLKSYHESWDLIMEIVEKIRSRGFEVHIKNDGTVIYKSDSTGNGHEEITYTKVEGGLSTSLTATYRAIMDFIRWNKK